MGFWWVNQNQTFKQEFEGGYLWSPKRNKNNARNPFYDAMRVVIPGDLVFCFVNTVIPAIAIVQGPCFESPKPSEFGGAGQNWSNVGWRVPVRYVTLNHNIRPANHMDLIAPALPDKYSPLQKSGRGLQSVYLTRVPNQMANILVGLIGHEARNLVDMRGADDFVAFDPGQIPEPVRDWENHIEDEIRTSLNIPDTDRVALVTARRGQGKFRDNVALVEKRCRITRVDRLEHLIASHSKPWRDCSSHEERLDGNNGLLLTPTIDHLFDRGFISFEKSGQVLISPVVHKESLRRMGIEAGKTSRVGIFSNEQDEFLEFHREKVFLDAPIARS